mmetsp:Transcript_18210/g.39257  ORF Transcript_18210/g.39257 Transcript_18210/m.39257 type:complete len:85 (-) Transcript_18210:94-348(-)
MRSSRTSPLPAGGMPFEEICKARVVASCKAMPESSCAKCFQKMHLSESSSNLPLCRSSSKREESTAIHHSQEKVEQQAERTRVK